MHESRPTKEGNWNQFERWEEFSERHTATNFLKSPSESIRGVGPQRTNIGEGFQERQCQDLGTLNPERPGAKLEDRRKGMWWHLA